MVGCRGVAKGRRPTVQLLHQDVEALQQRLSALTAEPVERSLERLEVGIDQLENLVGTALPHRRQGPTMVRGVLSALHESGVSQLSDQQAGGGEGDAEPLGEGGNTQGSVEYDLGESGEVARRERSHSR